MINSVVLVGRLTKDPELKSTGTGMNMVRFTTACDRKFKDQNGNRQADFINCLAWGKTAEVVANYFHKGSMIGVTGRIQTGSYENQQGQRVYTTDVAVESVSILEPKQKQQQQGQPQAYQQNYQQPYQQQSYQQQPARNTYQSDYSGMDDGSVLDIAPDDLPF